MNIFTGPEKEKKESEHILRMVFAALIMPAVYSETRGFLMGPKEVASLSYDHAVALTDLIIKKAEEDGVI